MKTVNSLLMPDTLDNSPPMVGGFRLKANQIAYWCWCLMLFFIPFSTALGLLMSALAIVSGLLGFSLQSFKKTCKQPVIILCVLLFGWLTLSMLWSIAPKAEMLEAWSKYRKLLYPALVMMVLYNLRKGPQGLVYGFLGGTGLVAVVSVASAYGLLELFLGTPEIAGGWYVGPGWLFIGGPDNPTFGRNHITQSAFLALAATLAIGKAWSFYREKNLRKGFVWILYAATYLQPIFQLQGRTGYLLVLLLCIYWTYSVLLCLSARMALICVGLATTVIVAMIFSSPHIVSRTLLMTDSIQKYVVDGQMKDAGVRIEFWKAGLEMLREKPMLGGGVGSYAEAYSLLEDRPQWLAQNRNQPHSEFVLIAVQGGFIALVIFTLLIVGIFSEEKKVLTQDPSLLGFSVLYFSNAAINSVIWDLAEGHVLCLVVIIAILGPIYGLKNRSGN